VPYILVGDSRAALAALATVWYGRPADGLTVVGVTGTNGKTTTTHLIKAMLEGALGAKTGLIGTIHNLIGNEELPAAHTTPEALELQRLLRCMADAGCTHVVMEVSSHALLLHRVDGIRFAAGVFTNLTQDHLDFHGTMENYRAAKELLFAQSAAAVLNLDDKAGAWYCGHLPCPAVTYSENKNEADVVAKNIRLHPDHVTFEAVSAEAIARATVPIPGGFTIYNALASVACARALGIPLKDACSSLGGARGVKGRIEVVPTGRNFTVLIDYAHTPNALENILLAVRDFAPGRIILVFGCGGDRDRSKRPVMGAAAAAGADVLVVTSDNPRTEKRGPSSPTSSPVSRRIFPPCTWRPTAGRPSVWRSPWRDPAILSSCAVRVTKPIRSQGTRRGTSTSARS
jgi:UDP-N-acetylmuramoyl-L-alanyl-D-glutamate--2,6-diaminopimelate ligase